MRPDAPRDIAVVAATCLGAPGREMRAGRALGPAATSCAAGFLLAACLLAACAAPPQRDGSAASAAGGEATEAGALAGDTAGPDVAAADRPRLGTVQCALPAPSSTPAWLRDAVGYQVWVRSFADSDGDGVGDLPGLTARLDYLNDGKPGGDDLGVDVLWLSPVFVSPSDHGYDTTDYLKIQPAYGTKADLLALLKAAHARGVRVMLDLVINHCSDQHPWFVASAASATSAKRMWFNWRADNPGWTQPWGPGGVWHQHDNGSWYYGLFWKGMPDLNLAHEETAAALEAVATHWVKLGVDGFRLDAARYLVETGGGAGQADTPATHAFWRRLRKSLTAVNPEVALVGEVWTKTQTVATYLKGDELHGAFDFDSCAGLRKGIELRSASLWRGALCSSAGVTGGVWGRFGGNHDMPRLADVATTPGDRKLALAAVLLAPGTPWLYQGDELGLPSGPSGGDRRYRLPLPWTASPPGYGFTTGTPWMPTPPAYGGLAVGKQLNDGLSLLRWAQRLIQTRRELSGLRHGASHVVRVDAGQGVNADLALLRFGPAGGRQSAGPGAPGSGLLALNFSNSQAVTVPKDLVAGGTRVLSFAGAGPSDPKQARVVAAPGVALWRW